ncbi:MAG: UDP-galactopyranose/dTDP-fucopyranose mutase family protein [Planctomycetota bacterium]
MARRHDPSDVVVVGAGFAGATAARALADAGRRVLLIDRRTGPGGNAADGPDAHGILVHHHGPHIFHTDSERVVAFLSRFTAWREYTHRVLAEHDAVLYPFPINRTTLERFFAVELPRPDDAERFLEERRTRIHPERNSEDVVRNRVGDQLFEAFFRHYTTKQWGREPAQLGPEVARRIPVRFDRDDRYFTHRHQGLPRDGYAALFANMLDHPDITTIWGEAYHAATHRHLAPLLIWSGPVDACFGHCHGHLPWRSLRFEPDHHPGTDLRQAGPVINAVDPLPLHTRSTEYRQLTGQSAGGSTLIREFPTDDGEPYYPVPGDSNAALHRRYAAMAARTNDTLFVGRLGRYRYLDMDRTVLESLVLVDRLVGAPA